MRAILIAVLLSASFLVGQDNQAGADKDLKRSKNQITVEGCVSRSNGDYILMKQDPAITYELQGSGKIRLRSYMGQRVEVTGRESPTLASSSDMLNRIGPAAPTTITVRSIKTVSKECTVDAARQ
jgi:hypothetical protein